MSIRNIFKRKKIYTVKEMQEIVDIRVVEAPDEVTYELLPVLANIKNLKGTKYEKEQFRKYVIFLQMYLK